MIEYAEREGIQIKLQDVGHNADVEDTYVGRYNWVVSRYNAECEKSYEELEYLPTGCCRGAKYDKPYNSFRAWRGTLLFAVLFPILSALVYLIIWLSNIEGLLIYRRNNKRAPDMLGRFIYCPELCGDSNNKYYDLSLRYYHAGMLSFNGQNIQIDAARIKVAGDKISFMVYNDAFQDFSVCVRRMYIYYTLGLILSMIVCGVAIKFLRDY